MRQRIFILFTILISLNSFSQFDADFATELESFQSISKPSPNSHLSQYLITNLGTKYLSRIKFSDKQKSNEKTIRLRFKISDKNRPTNMTIYAGNRELNKNIMEVLKNYPVEKLGLNDSNKLGIYSVQLFSREKNRTIINASRIAICDTPPIFKNCTSIKFYNNLTSCFYKELKNHIIKNFSMSIFSETKRKKMKSLKLFISFSIDTNGKIYNINEEAFKFKTYMNNPVGYKNPKDIDQELSRILKLLGTVVTPAMRNGKPIFYNYDTFYSFPLKQQ
ncbi:hypothetical protein GCM10023314_20040 [Algibacter agarivorans]|uniref:Uncharacterized protein n=1 Tax=Algibacter agarivorans TaxID=1109741 RepID=A0ABP9GKR0_9FLAO